MSIPIQPDSLIILVPIFILLFFSCFIIIERLLFFKKHAKTESSHYESLKALLKRGNTLDAKHFCEDHPSSLSALTLLAVNNRMMEKESLKELVAGAADLQVPRLERFISPLGTIAAVAPLLGLLGTVTGNIKAFGFLGEGTIQNYQMLAPAIGEALYTTAAGLLVAIPSIIFYNFLVRKVHYHIALLENRINELVNLIGG